MEIRPIRRIVTGNDARGVAVVVSDAPTPHVRTSPHRPGVAFTNVWTTDRMPVDAAGSTDPVTPAMGLGPPPHGTNFRIVEFGPEQDYIGAVDAEGARRAFAAMGGAEHALDAGATPRHPFMHKTETVDYGIVLSGEIYLVLDESEVLMRAGDVCIQRAANHAWSNRSTQPCLMAFVLIDGQRSPG
jgi:mannose-6-phosphate isomerase-like protein (cupin superfamily)